MTPTRSAISWRLLDVVRGEDDRHALLPQARYQLPHVLAQGDIHTRRRLVQKQDARLVGQRLGDEHPSLHATRKLTQRILPLVKQGEVFENLVDQRRIGFAPVQAAGEADRIDDAFEHIRRQFLRNQTDLAARLAEVLDHVVADTRTWPLVGLLMPQTMEISVVLPAPFGPSKARISPSSMSRDTFLSAENPLE